MPFFDPMQQQMLMQQMFRSPDGGGPLITPQAGQGGVGQSGLQLAPGFEGPSSQQLGIQGMPQMNGPMPMPQQPQNFGGPGQAMNVPLPGGPQGDPFSRMPPDVGDQMNSYSPQANTPDMNRLPQDVSGGAGFDLGASGMDEEKRNKLIEAIMRATGRF